MEMPTNPFAILTFISAPAVLTNASCVLLFGTGNRYGRAIDRMHQLSSLVEGGATLSEAELGLRIRQLEAGEARTSLIVRALTCFYTAVSGFVASTLISLIGAVLVFEHVEWAVSVSFALAALAGVIGVAAMIAGALMLARETTFSFRILQDERKFITEHITSRSAILSKASPIIEN
jgi:hypothetical protein